MMIAVPWITRGRKWQVERRAADCKFMQRQFAEQDRARRTKAAHDFGVRLRNVFLEDFRVASRDIAGNIDDVLDTDGHAMQRTAYAACADFAFRFARHREHPFPVELDECV